MYYGYTTSTTCSGTPYVTESLSSQCLLNKGDDDDGNWNYNTYGNWVLQTGVDWDFDDDNTTLNDGQIAGIVIGVIAFFVLFGLLIYCCFFVKQIQVQ